MSEAASRRRFVKGVVAGAAAAGSKAMAQTTGRVRGFDHVALPMENEEAMMAFYRGLGFDVAENPVACSVIARSCTTFRPGENHEPLFTASRRFEVEDRASI